jgi:hypothetical protein
MLLQHMRGLETGEGAQETLQSTYRGELRKVKKGMLILIEVSESGERKV